MTTTKTQTRQDASHRRIDPTCASANFLVTCDAQQMYLRLANDTGRSIGVFRLQPLGSPRRWGRKLKLEPGGYRYRYYAMCGGLMLYADPRDIDDTPQTMDGRDAILYIPAEPTSERERKQHVLQS